MLKFLLKVISVLISIQLSLAVNTFRLKPERSTVSLEVKDFFFMLEYSIIRDGETIQVVSVTTDPGTQIQSRQIANGLIISGRGVEIEFHIEEQSLTYTEFSVRRTRLRKPASDCIELGRNVNWFGGNQQRWQYYPIQIMQHKHTSYLTKEENNKGIAERYWLNSNGVFFYVDLDAPLFIDQNNQYIGYLCLETKRSLPYDIYHAEYDFKYRIGVGNNARDAHMKAINKFFKKPVGHPAEIMVRKPIFSTWARYKQNINDEKVREFAQEILDNNYETSQLEIDDDWEICYGALEFRTSKFPNITTLTQFLKSQGFRVTLWIHPFINKNCEPYFSTAKSKGYLVADHQGNVATKWWNSKDAAYIDFTKPDAVKWFTDRLKKLVEAGIDSFKFDAGETSWVPPDPVLNGSSSLSPHTITMEYVKAVSQFGSLVEVRSGQNTQNLPIFVRMIDKDTEWSYNNGLPTLITTLLQMNLNGYVFVLPDMIGGNGYGASFDESFPPNKEIFLRWLQANTFMPSIQFSYVPWEYDEETLRVSKQMVDLHEKYANVIMERFRMAVKTGDPVNPPIWWIAPDDQVAQRTNDEYLLGETILVAPVIKEGATKRDIYLPGHFKWKDGNTNITYDGPQLIRDYEAPLNILPYFIRQ